MSILIKGMEMPNNCTNCAARHGAECWLANCSYIPNYHKKRPKWCPLVPVPPHGRLGDLDTFESIKYELPEGQKAFNRGFHSGVQYVQRLIMDAPTIIPAEEG